MIKEILVETEVAAAVTVIRNSFITVADDLQLTEENAPTNPAFLTIDRLKDSLAKGVRLFGLYIDGRIIGTVAIEKAAEQTFYLERLAVLPEFRHASYGRQLLDYAFRVIKEDGGQQVSIAVINENEVLKKWYREYGFQETGIKNFPHLPFTVCFMVKTTL